MPSLALKLTRRDAATVLDWLNADPEIAFLVPDGPARWRAVSEFSTSSDGVCDLWHIPAGPLPLIEADGTDSGQIVSDPWKGWTELRAAGQPGVPWLGDTPRVIHLEIWVNGSSIERKPSAPEVGTSYFSWVGNHWSTLGRPASPLTAKWWQRLRRWITRQSVVLLSHEPRLKRPFRYWAFPDAFSQLSDPTLRQS